MLKKIILFLFLVLTFTTIGFADVIGPDGITRDYYGSKEFDTKTMTTELYEDALIIKAYTPYPLTDIAYNKGDIILRFSNTETIGIILKGKDKGNVVLNPTWETSYDAFKEIGEYCKDAATGEYVSVNAKSGRVIGKATILEEKLSENEYKITIVVPRRLLEGKNFSIKWGTAQCGNSVVGSEVYVPRMARGNTPVMPYAIDPSFKNNNPVVPYWSGVPYYGGWGYPGCGWYDGPFWDGDGGDKPNPPPVPLPTSGLLFLSGLLFFMKKVV